MGLGILTNGKWISEREQEDEQGKFIRPSTTFRNKITADGASGFKAEPGRYHLYISWACPWAHRTALMRSLKELEDAISLSVVAPEIDQNGWEFSDEPGSIPDSVNGTRYLWEVYLKAEPNYSGRVTVPVLWDKATSTIVNNESREIIRMLDMEFEAIAAETPISTLKICRRKLIRRLMPSINQLTMASIEPGLLLNNQPMKKQ